MLDSQGNKLKIGDTVVFLKGKNSNASLDVGTITKFYTNYYGDECSVQYSFDGKLNSQSHLPGFRLVKISEGKINENINTRKDFDER